ncbi:MAG: transporter substrate-binding domain-containing protein [Algicola sp.]|nr:transporter substrate-binding domain-containing protein [Algicola sp.]
MKDHNDQWIGTDLDYTKALLDKVGCKFNILNTPWARGIEMLKLGKVDMMLNVTKSAQRAPFFYFVGPHRIETIRLITKKRKLPMISTWQQFESLDTVLMRQRGSIFGDRFDLALKRNFILKSKLVDLANNEVRVDLIHKGRATGFFADSAYLNYHLKNTPEYAILEMHPLIIHSDPVYFAFSKASMDKALMTKIYAAFDELAGTGKLEQIERTYSH